MPFYSVRRRPTEIAPTDTSTDTWVVVQQSLVSPLPMMTWNKFQTFLRENPEYEQVIAHAPAVKVH